MPVIITFALAENAQSAVKNSAVKNKRVFLSILFPHFNIILYGAITSKRLKDL
ncbi:hypothetical protein HAINFHK1212_1175 [Haemophilus influenzae HK1212]|uniref:Uncharacterized protein n=1 Tax=Haemophilus influenzae HK1212 TaxID=456482 RepID=A0A7G2K0W1_HAEIF|nr:hypothetical protein HAINFHK1212_1175 [Haemophilus influenzae HK1212]